MLIWTCCISQLRMNGPSHLRGPRAFIQFVPLSSGETLQYGGNVIMLSRVGTGQGWQGGQGHAHHQEAGDAGDVLLHWHCHAMAPMLMVYSYGPENEINEHQLIKAELPLRLGPFSPPLGLCRAMRQHQCNDRDSRHTNRGTSCSKRGPHACHNAHQCHQAGITCHSHAPSWGCPYTELW